MRQSLIAVYLHLIWATWDRLPLLDAAIERDVYRAIQAKAHDLATEVLAIGGVEDHVHVLVHLPATITVAALVQGLKGASAHLVTHELRPGKFFQWQGAYAAFSIGTRQLSQVKDYIARQREHHTVGGSVIQWEQAIFHKLHHPSAPTTDQESQPA